MSKVDTKIKEVDGYSLSFDSEWTSHLESKEHWGFYWVQAWLVHELTKPEDRLLEIGVGTGFLSNYLRARGRAVVTVDIDGDKSPDIVSDASSYDFSAEKFAAILAFEVFEHMPFPLFKRTVQNISFQKPASFLFSIPWSVRSIGSIKLKFPKTPVVEARVDIPKKKIFTKNHFWELKKRGNAAPEVLDGSVKGLVSIKDVLAVFEEQDYSVEPVHREGRIQFFKASRNDG